ncbi:LytTR family DNA-binding domain-containing protein [Vibrio atypicus]|uniref:hypothetical protein n=1 Tax=Vibrio atypicus TaxID=558271 RepID=UPI0037362F19
MASDQRSKLRQIALAALLLILTQAMLVIAYFNTLESKTPNDSLAGALIEGWTKTDAFLDDIYTFNTDGIRSSLQRFISAYEQSNIDADMCIQVTIHSFTSNNRDILELCTADTSIPKLTTRASRIEVNSNSLPITMGNKKVAVVNYYLAEKLTSFQDKYFVSSLNLFILAELLSFAAFFALMKLILLNHPPTKAYEENDAPVIPPERQQIENICKIINSNKRAFALNEDVVLITYSHPYSKVIYKSGLSTKIKCSLVDLEQSFPLALIRINRSTLVNQELLQVGDNVDIKASKDSHQVIINVKGQKYELKVSNHYKDNLLTVISRGN